MNIANILIITLFSALVFYCIFLILGMGGISQNRRAQGLDQNHKSDS